jgi:small subunit ribosomal protein S9
MANQYHEGIGRRKTSTARVRITSGSGKLMVNGKEGQVYFPRQGDLDNAMAPLRAVGMESKLDVTATVSGGGISGQTGAVRRGLALALIALDPAMQPALRSAKFVTRDARAKERKKPGLKRARKAPTYTKR